jgi:predicted nucleic acid-binding Zn ribbon protein
MPDEMPFNPQRRTAIICWIVTALLIFAIFAPSIFGMDGFNGGYAISFISLVAAITSLVVAVMYQGRARALDRILNGETLLAHWKYDPAEWQGYAEKEYKRQRTDKRNLFYLVAVISLVVGVIFTITHRDGGWVVLEVLGGLLVLILIVIELTTRYDYMMNRKYVGEAYISPDGVYLNRMLHLFRGWGASLDDVSYDEVEKFLAFCYSTPNRTGRADYTVRVPVPDGKEDEARRVIASFQTQNNI